MKLFKEAEQEDFARNPMILSDFIGMDYQLEREREDDLLRITISIAIAFALLLVLLV